MIDAISNKEPSSAWEKYENYRQTLFKNQGDPGDPDLSAGGTQETDKTKKVNNTGECQTCDSRRYQDGSDDPGVSFKTPTQISPEQAFSSVQGHEREHVSRERSKADREDRKVVSQSVTYHTGICPECGTTYVSGGTTRTVTKSDQKPETNEAAKQEQKAGAPKSGFDAYA